MNMGFGNYTQGIIRPLNVWKYSYYVFGHFFSKASNADTSSNVSDQFEARFQNFPAQVQGLSTNTTAGFNPNEKPCPPGQV